MTVMIKNMTDDPKILKFEQTMNLFHTDVDHELLHEITSCLQGLKDWDWESRLYNSNNMTLDSLTHVSVTTHYNQLVKIHDKLERLAKIPK